MQTRGCVGVRSGSTGCGEGRLAPPNARHAGVSALEVGVLAASLRQYNISGILATDPAFVSATLLAPGACKNISFCRHRQRRNNLDTNRRSENPLRTIAIASSNVNKVDTVNITQTTGYTAQRWFSIIRLHTATASVRVGSSAAG
ncbi:hypothetical protein F444_19791 [Phytophthora nicotianae P1976]|uniref:Uncharacterized protein n=1 Tax=Phytophthora nicotianae P1976 TaxID=1317066 RepID=A0A080Z6M1_PHYNI|nr:hypothetical protein F444_19791 [Phytophthora nicotianae P1976]